MRRTKHTIVRGLGFVIGAAVLAPEGSAQGSGVTVTLTQGWEQHSFLVLPGDPTPPIARNAFGPTCPLSHVHVDAHADPGAAEVDGSADLFLCPRHFLTFPWGDTDTETAMRLESFQYHGSRVPNVELDVGVDIAGEVHLVSGKASGSALGLLHYHTNVYPNALLVESSAAAETKIGFSLDVPIEILGLRLSLPIRVREGYGRHRSDPPPDAMRLLQDTAFFVHTLRASASVAGAVDDSLIRPGAMTASLTGRTTGSVILSSHP